MLFAAVLTGHASLGDAPETIAGVSSLGILHDPGYPVYVIAAHLFTLLIPFGSEAFAVNLFSLVCASLTIAGVVLLARRCGAPRWAGAIGALALAASPGFWYYSGFAKHDIFSGLLLLVTIHLALAWQVRPSPRRLGVLAGAVALGLGSSWPLELTVLPAVALVLLHGAPRRLAPRGDLRDRGWRRGAGRRLRVRDGEGGAEPGRQLGRRDDDRRTLGPGRSR